MAQNVNQLAQTPVLGQIDLEFNSSVVTCRVSANQATPLIAGQIVKVENSAGGVPAVLALAAATDVPHGVVLRNLKDQNFPATSRFEMAMEGTVVYMNSGGAINRFSNVEGVFATPGNVVSAAGVNPVIGFAFDQATAANQLIRVFVRLPNLASSNIDRDINAVTTLAQLNAGPTVLIPGVAGKSINVNDFIERINGTFTTGTSITLQSGTTGVLVATLAEAGLTNGAVLIPGTANVTLGAGYGAALPVGESLVIQSNGAAQAGGVSIASNISFIQA